MATGLAHEGLFINGSYTRVGPVTDVHQGVANRHAARFLSAFTTSDFYFVGRKTRDLMMLPLLVSTTSTEPMFMAGTQTYPVLGS